MRGYLQLPLFLVASIQVAFASVVPVIMGNQSSQPPGQSVAPQKQLANAGQSAGAAKIEYIEVNKPSTFQPPSSLNPEGVVLNSKSTTAKPLPPKQQPAHAAPKNIYQPVPAASSSFQEVEKPKVRFPTRKMGKPQYFVSTSSPYAEVIMYSGKCPPGVLIEFKQIAVDRGLLTRRKSPLRYAVSNTESGGRSVGCWYRDPVSRTFRTMFDNGTGEVFAMEQVDRAY